jgi:hypothetical protein
LLEKTTKSLEVSQKWSLSNQKSSFTGQIIHHSIRHVSLYNPEYFRFKGSQNEGSPSINIFELDKISLTKKAQHRFPKNPRSGKKPIKMGFAKIDLDQKCSNMKLKAIPGGKPA